jgi:hypothetical protein
LSNQKHPDLIKITEIFLIPSSFLVAALGTADTNLHRAAVSALGLVISALWWACSRDAMADILSPEEQAANARHPVRLRVLSALPWVFALGWLFSMAMHMWLWNQPLGKDT